MNTRVLWSRILVIAGSIAMLGGAIDPMEGAFVILPGSGMVVLGTLLDTRPSRPLRYWVSVFLLIATGVGALFVLSALGGLGGTTGRSMWWGLLILPYPIGWVMGFARVVWEILEFFKFRRHRALAR